VRQGLVSFASGLVFAAGLGLAGMTKPSKVVGFLDFFGAWDPSLMMVMVGAIAVNGLAYAWARRRAAPLLGDRFLIPSRREIDGRLVAGAALFGVGWGLAGFCPGPAVVTLAALAPDAAVFVPAMLVGMALFHRFDRSDGA